MIALPRTDDTHAESARAEIRQAAKARFSGGTYCFRKARAEDASACAPLIFASGEQELEYLLGVPRARCIAFLEAGFRANMGRFSWTRHYVVADHNGVVVGVMAFHDARQVRWDDLAMVMLLLTQFSVWRATGIVMRGVALKNHLTRPRRHQILMAHCAVKESLRASGIFTHLFRYGVSREVSRVGEDRELLLDVRVANTRARDLYRRLGFSSGTNAPYPRPKRLPATLHSIRMSRRLSA